jgi:hypothetical protein
MKEALRLTKDKGWSLYRVCKRYSIQWSILKDSVHKTHLGDPASISLEKIGKLFVIPPDLEIKVVAF